MMTKKCYYGNFEILKIFKMAAIFCRKNEEFCHQFSDKNSRHYENFQSFKKIVYDIVFIIVLSTCSQKIKSLTCPYATEMYKYCTSFIKNCHYFMLPPSLFFCNLTFCEITFYLFMVETWFFDC